MWRYAPVLPDVTQVTLGEGWTPILPSRRNPNVLLKEEGTNPTGTFKARGMSMCMTMIKHYGISKVAVPSAGNAGGACAAYAAAAGVEAHIFMPQDVPLANQVECIAYGAHMTLVDGLISDCAKIVASRKEEEGWFDVSTLKEPFRVEGKKTMGYELVEQCGWTYPEAVFYPTGGGVGLIGMWKAFLEMEELGWVTGKAPEDDCGASCWLRTRHQGLPGGRGCIGRVPECAHPCKRPPRSQALRRLHHPRCCPAIRRHCHLADRRRNLCPPSKIGAPMKASCFRPKAPLLPPPMTVSSRTDFSSRATAVVIFNTGTGNKYTDVLSTMQRAHRANAEPA